MHPQRAAPGVPRGLRCLSRARGPHRGGRELLGGGRTARISAPGRLGRRPGFDLSAVRSANRGRRRGSRCGGRCLRSARRLRRRLAARVALCGLTLVYAAALPFLGFTLSTAGFLAASFRLLGERRFGALVIVPLAIAVVCLVLLRGALGAYLPDPLLERLL